RESAGERAGTRQRRRAGKATQGATRRVPRRWADDYRRTPRDSRRPGPRANRHRRRPGVARGVVEGRGSRDSQHRGQASAVAVARDTMNRPDFGIALALILASSMDAEEPRRDRFGEPLPPGAIARLGTVQAHVGVEGIAFSADGKTLVSWSRHA